MHVNHNSKSKHVRIRRNWIHNRTRVTNHMKPTKITTILKKCWWNKIVLSFDYCRLRYYTIQEKWILSKYTKTETIHRINKKNETETIILFSKQAKLSKGAKSMTHTHMATLMAVNVHGTTQRYLVMKTLFYVNPTIGVNNSTHTSNNFVNSYTYWWCVLGLRMPT